MGYYAPLEDYFEEIFGILSIAFLYMVVNNVSIGTITNAMRRNQFGYI